jgi:hypothetical protein
MLKHKECQGMISVGSVYVTQPETKAKISELVRSFCLLCSSLLAALILAALCAPPALAASQGAVSVRLKSCPSEPKGITSEMRLEVAERDSAMQITILG